MYRTTGKNERYYIHLNKEKEQARVLVRGESAYEGDNFIYMIDPFTDAIIYGFQDEVMEVSFDVFQKAFRLASAGKSKELYDLGFDAQNWQV